MKTFIKFIAFLVYTICLFWVQDFTILAVITIFQIILMLLCRLSTTQALKSIFKLLPFILFTVIINALAMDIIDAILIGIRLMLVCNITYIYGKTTTAMQIAKAITSILLPLKLFGVNTNNIGIMVSIAITFIPIIKQEIQNIKYSLKSKGFDMRLGNTIKHINYIMVPLFYSLLKKVREIEEALKAKAYVEE